MPLFDQLTGKGNLQTSQVAIKDFPAFDKLAALTKLNILDDPTMRAIRSQFEIRDGRLHLQPFSVGLGGTTMTVAGSNGLDQSLQYDLGLPGAAQPARGRGEPGDRRGAGAGRPRGDRPPGVPRDRARHPGHRHRHRSRDQGRSAQRRRVGGRGGEAGGGAAGGDGGGLGRCARRARGRGGAACRPDPGGGEDAGGDGEAGGLPPGRLAGGAERRGARGHRRRRRGERLRKEADDKAARIVREADQRGRVAGGGGAGSGRVRRRPETRREDMPGNGLCYSVRRC